MKTWKVKSTAREQSREEVKILTRASQLDSLSSLQFVIAMMTLNRKYTGGYKFTKSPKKINYFIYMDGIKVFVEKGKRNGDHNTNNLNIQPRYRNGI